MFLDTTVHGSRTDDKRCSTTPEEMAAICLDVPAELELYDRVRQGGALPSHARALVRPPLSPLATPSRHLLTL